MTLRRCIPGLVADGRITPERAREMELLYDDLERYYRRQFGSQQAAAMASEETVAAMERAAALKNRRNLLQIAAQDAARAARERYGGGAGGRGGDGGGGRGPVDPAWAAALFDDDPRAPYSNVYYQWRVTKGQAHAYIDGILARNSRDVFGRIRRKAELDDIGREAFGQSTGNLAAKEFAGGWLKAAEMLRQRRNAVGGATGKIENWGLPQVHDSQSVRRAGYERWRADILPELNRARMIDERTGRPFSNESFELAMRDVFETIRTDGMNKVTPGTPHRAMLASRRDASRFFHFKDYDAWKRYSDKYGAASPFDAMMGHIDGMSRDIARMDILGPNPDATARWLQDEIERDAALVGDDAGKAIDRAYSAARKIERLDAEITGAWRRPENRTIALTFSTIRAVQTSAKLGSATLSAVSDVGFQNAARRLNGLSTAATIPQYLKLLRPGSIEDQRLAVRLGLIGEEWSQMSAASHRYLNEELTGEVARRLASFVMRSSGLARVTQHGRWVFGMEFLGHVTEMRGHHYDNLDPAFRSALGRYGIDAGDWDIVRKTPTIEERGLEWIKPAEVRDRDVGDALMRMILTETDHAVPTADLKTRAWMHSVGAKSPQLVTEIGKSAFLFKSFGISVALRQGGRIMAMPGAWTMANYAARLFIGVTLWGALALQLKEISKGRDPRPMNNLEFWGAAVLQGGGFGIFGDFFGAAENRFGGGFASTLAGPLPQSADKLARFGKALVDEEENAAGAGISILRSELPGGSLWYARLAFERMVLDQADEALNPNFDETVDRQFRWAEQHGQDFFWAPGEEMENARAPDLANAWEGEAPE